MATDNSNSLTVADALQAEDARYEAQMQNDFDALDSLFAEDLVYIHSARYRTPRRASLSHCAQVK